MSSLASSVVSSSDWMLLSEFLFPNLSSSHNVNIDTIKDDAKGTADAWTSSNDGPYQPVFITDDAVTTNESTFQNMNLDLRCDDIVYEPIQISILDEAFQAVWSTDCPSLSQGNSPSEFTSKFKHSWDAMQVSPTHISEYTFEEPPITTAEVGTQTMAASISWLPIAGIRPTSPMGLKTDKPSPLTVNNNSKKRKFDKCTAWEDSNSPPKKRATFDNQDYGYLNSLFDYLKSPSINDDYVDEKSVNQTLTPCEYEGFVEVDHHNNLALRSVATNTIHVPVRRLPHQYTRSKSWKHAAKQFIREEDRMGKRGSRQGTKEDRTKRMTETILAYYCR